MTKLGQELIESAKEAPAIARGEAAPARALHLDPDSRKDAPRGSATADRELAPISEGHLVIRYAVNLSPDDNGTILVAVPDIPEAITFGKDREDALARAVDAIATAIMRAIAAGARVPRPKTEGETYVTLPPHLADAIEDELDIVAYDAAKAKNPADFEKLFTSEEVDAILDADGVGPGVRLRKGR